MASSVMSASLREVDAEQLELGLDVTGADAEDDRPPDSSSRVMNDFAVTSGWR